MANTQNQIFSDFRAYDYTSQRNKAPQPRAHETEQRLGACEQASNRKADNDSELWTESI